MGGGLAVAVYGETRTGDNSAGFKHLALRHPATESDLPPLPSPPTRRLRMAASASRWGGVSRGLFVTDTTILLWVGENGPWYDSMYLHPDGQLGIRVDGYEVRMPIRVWHRIGDEYLKPLMRFTEP